VVQLLNEYLTEMTGKVIEHHGTLDKFIGDAIMAFWGAPVRHEDHAWRAVSTALDMAAALEQLQETWQARGLPRIEIGIGINSGDMVIGEMGAQGRNGAGDRVDFTAIGDAVNLASRVEGVNKNLSTRILITDATYEYVRDRVLVRGPFEVQVKGKRDPIMVYEPYGRTSTDNAGAAQAP
jgi:adenylate cyclase